MRESAVKSLFPVLRSSVRTSALSFVFLCVQGARTHTHTHTPARCLIHCCARSTQGGGVYKAARGGHTPLRLKHFRPQAARLRSREYKYQPRQKKQQTERSEPPELRVRSSPVIRSLVCFHWNTEAAEAALEEVGSKLSGVWSESLCAVALVEVKCAETWTSSPGHLDAF